MDYVKKLDVWKKVVALLLGLFAVAGGLYGGIDSYNKSVIKRHTTGVAIAGNAGSIKGLSARVETMKSDNADQHKALRDDINDIKTNVASIDGKIDTLLRVLVGDSPRVVAER